MDEKEAKQLQDQVDQLALERRKLEETVGELSLLIEIASAISSALTVEEINNRIVAQCVQRLGVEQGAVHLLQSDPADLLKSQVRVYGSAGDQGRLRLNPTLIGWMLKKGTTLLSNDLPRDSRFPGVDNRGSAIQSILSTPMLSKGEAIGFLTLFNKLSAQGFTSQDERVLSAIASHCAQVIEMARLNEQELRLRAHECQLREARRIHQQLLPQGSPGIDGVDIAGLESPASTVGGDYYGYIALSQGRWGIAVADVTGHGLGAALMMSDLQATLRASSHLTGEASDCVAAVNWLFAQPPADEVNRYASLFYAVLDPVARSLTYSNAGHNPPMLVRSDGRVEKLDSGGLMLGVFATSVYEQVTVRLDQEDLLLIFTDGVTEAVNPTGEMFDEYRLLDSIRRHKDQSAARLLDGIMDDLRQFQRGVELGDDVTLVCLKVL